MSISNIRQSDRGQGGFTLIELMIVMAVMLIISASVFSMMGNSLKVTSSTYEVTEAQENQRIAQEYINRDLIVAGNGLNGISNIQLTKTFAQSYLTASPVISPTNAAVAIIGIITSDNNVPAGTAVLGTNPAVTVRSNPAPDGPTDRLTILTADTSFTPIDLPAGSITPSGANVSITSPELAGANFQIGQIYAITSSIGATFGAITNITGASGNSPNLIFAASDPYNLNQPGNGGPINTISSAGTVATTLLRVQMIHYFVDSNGLLIRRVFGVPSATGFIDTVIAEHVYDMQFTYTLNLRDGNGLLVQPVTQLTSSNQQVNVRDVGVSIRTETVHPILNNNTTRYVLPAAATITSVRNMQFRQALQP